MRELSDKTVWLIRDGVRRHGRDPNMVYLYIEESLLCSEAESVQKFLRWLFPNAEIASKRLLPSDWCYRAYYNDYQKEVTV